MIPPPAPNRRDFLRLMSIMGNGLLNISCEVEKALGAQKPVVALESTVIAHGLPYPQNLETACRLEQIVREAGSTPATIAILDGKVCVGLSDEQIKIIAHGNNIRKVSTRDLPVAVALRWNGATTVASSIWVAYRAGIRVFATGGIGGVHRGQLPDVSADLPELARTPLVAVCSGAKSVLDLPATHEWLETHGVMVLGYQSDEMPAFFSRCSGLSVDARIDSPPEVVKFDESRRLLGMNGAILVTVPVPKNAEVRIEDLKNLINIALGEAERNGTRGRDLTALLLARINSLSAGATLKANISLLENNARVASEISVALHTAGSPVWKENAHGMTREA